MKLTKIPIVFVVLAVDLCFAGIAVKTYEPIDSSELIDAAVHTLSSCYGEHGPIGIVRSLPKTLLSKLWSKKPIPVILIDGSKRMDEESWTPRGKLSVFLLIAASPYEAFRGIYDMLDSQWYDRRAPVLVLRSAPNMKANGCEEYYWILMVFRRFGLYNLNLICRSNAEKKISMFSFNPHTNWAPPPWQSISYEIRNNMRLPRLFLFERQYKATYDICNNLDYDRTKDMGGEPIHIYDPVVRSWHEWENKKLINRLDIYNSKYLNVWRTILRQLNATPKVHNTGDGKLVVRPSMGGVSIGPCSVINVPAFRPIIQPVMLSRSRILTQHRGDKTQLAKILTVVDTSSRYCVGVTLLITLLFFKFVAHQRLVPGMLNVIRMLCNTGFTNLPENLTSRSYLTCLFLPVVTMHGIFAGNLASLLTTRIPVRHAETVEDLVEFNYTIYAGDAIFLVLNKTQKYKARLNLIYYSRQCGVVLKDPTNSCIYNDQALLWLGERYDLHVSQTDIFMTYETFETILETPYTHRFSEIILRQFEADIMSSLETRVTKNRADEYQDFVQREGVPPRVMNFNDLAFAFVILGIGLGCAMISFVIEISLKPALSRIVKVRRFLRH